MKKMKALLVVTLVVAMVLSLATPAFAKGGSFGGGRSSFSSSRSFSSSSRSYGTGTKSFSTSTKSYSSTPRYSPGYTSTTKPSTMSGFKTYTNTTGQTVYYRPKTYAQSPRSYYDPAYGYANPYHYYYTSNTGSDFWFWMWMMGRNNQGVDAPRTAAVVTTGTADSGLPSNEQVKAVKVPEKAAWGTYDTGDKIVIALLWVLIVLSGIGVLWLLFAGVRALLGYKYKFRFWKSEYSRGY